MARKGVENKKSNKLKKIIIVLLLLILVCIGIIVYLIFESQKVVSDYPKGIIDKNVIKTDDDSSKMEKSDGGGAVSLSYSKDVTIDLVTKKVEINFKNPSKSTQSMVLELIIKQDEEDIILAQTDRIPSGHSIYEMTLSDNVTIEKGKYNGIFNINYYDEETEEKAVVNTNIPVEIIVK